MLSLSDILNNTSFIKEKQKMKQTKDANVINEEKISLNFSNLTNINYDIPGRFHNVKKLYLSNNDISDLTGIEVFNKLTNLSLQKNKLLDFIEILKLPTSIENLSIQGNFIEKNPNLYVMLIDRFKKLQEIDGFKITNETRKTLESAKILKSQIIPILSILQELTYNTIKIVNLIKINLELNFSFAENNHTDFYTSKKEKIEILLNKLNLNLSSEEFTILKEKYLKSNINPSVFVINKLFSNVFKSKLNLSEFGTDEENIENNYQNNSNKLANIDKHKEHNPILRLYYNNTQTYNLNQKSSSFKNFSNTTLNENTNDMLKKINQNSLIYKNLSMKIEPQIILSNAIAKYFNEENRNELSKIYLDLFACIMKQYVIKGNYGSLPTFLNYKILKSNNQIEQFLKDALRYDKKYFNYLKTSLLNENELTIYICKNLDKLFGRYTNCTSETLSKLQFFHFFHLDEQTCSVLEQQNFLQNQNRKEIYKYNTSSSLKTEEGNEYLHFSNPFSLRLNQKSDIFPDKPKSKIKFETKNLDLYSKKDIENNQLDEFDLSKIHLQIIDSLCDISGQKNISEKILNIMPLEYKVDVFINIFPVMEFPIFPLNFEYMRVLTNVIQDKIYKYVDCFDEIINIYNQIDFLKNKFAQSYNKNKIQQDKEKSKQHESLEKIPNDKIKETNLNNNYITHNHNTKKDKNYSKANTSENLANESYQTFNQKYFNTNSDSNFISNSNANVISDNNQIIPKTNSKNVRDKNISESFSKLTNCFKSYFFYEFKEKIKHKPKIRYLTFTKRIISKLNDFILKTKYQFLTKLITDTNIKTNLKTFLKKRINSYKLKALSLIINNHKKLKIISNQHVLSLKSKAYFSLAKYYYMKKFEADKISNSRLYYYKYLVKKLFMIFKFNLSQKENRKYSIEKNNFIQNTCNLKSQEDFNNEIDFDDNNVFIKNSLVPSNTYKNSLDKNEIINLKKSNTPLNVANNYANKVKEINNERNSKSKSKSKSKPKLNLNTNSYTNTNTDNDKLSKNNSELKGDLNNELDTLLKKINQNIKENTKKSSENYKKTQYNQINKNTSKIPNTLINQTNLSIIKQAQIASPLFSTKSLKDANLSNANDNLVGNTNISASINIGNNRKNQNSSFLNNSKKIIVGNPNFLNRTKNTLFKELI